ncbi:MAG: phosphoribosylaminoimidazolesuccinocarboxamide synthase [Sulfurovum sp.]|uniref:phosphoribosylaminoimidazolesuccinocarboxamide synthase n=1 Tax=Sulfurovum sp. TaxID=1969726 RepID=UPI002867E13D|nr:phosphoribosylaminoimidazolesuccinocarboxamide synthase [Sulfurovum sp.]MCO4845483.1 phosphoribosylaminoimidazolesuccinocarboxamide synthase [Sulfurovum sp.]
MTKTSLLYEGKAKKIWKTEDKDLLISEFKDSLTAFNGEKKSSEEGKGALNNQISTELFKYLDEKGVPTHYVDTIDDNNMLHKAAEVIYIEVIVRNIATGSLSKNLGIEDKTILPFTLVEFDYKNDALGDPKLNDQHCLILNLVNDTSELDYIRFMARRINTLLVEFYAGLDIKVVDFKVEFGRDKDGNIILIDELSPDNFRLWDAKTDEKLDKDRFRQGLGGLTEAYRQVLDRIKNR